MYEKFKTISFEEYVTRRGFLTRLGWSVVGASAGSVLLGAAPRPALAQASDPRLAALAGSGTVVVSDPGGPLTKALATALHEPFRKATGINTRQLAREAEPIAAVKSMVQAKKVIWDATSLTAEARLVLTKEGLLEPLRWDSLPFAKDELVKEAVAPDWMGNWVFASVIVHRTDKFSGDNAPRSWADFYDVKRFPGRRSLWKMPVWTMEQALLADGVAPKDLYPLDIERALRKMDTIKDSVIWYTGGAQATQLLQSGEVALSGTWNTRAQAAIDGGAPVAIQWEQGLTGIEGFAIPKGAPNLDNAQKFLCFSSWAQNQAAWTPFSAIAPTNFKAYEFVPKDRYAALATAPGNAEKLISTSFNWWADNLKKVQERFETWLIH